MLNGPGWLQLLRVGRVGLFVRCLVIVGLLAVTVPPKVAVPLRDVSDSPWSMLWTIPGMVMPFVLDPRLDFMLRALPLRQEVQRLVIVVACLGVSVPMVLVLGAVTVQPIDVGLRSLLFFLALALMFTILLRGEIVALLLFVAALIAWIFGRDAVTGLPHDWAWLIRPASLAHVATALVMYCVAGLAWALAGSRGGRP
jgi:hypothetical protein